MLDEKAGTTKRICAQKKPFTSQPLHDGWQAAYATLMLPADVCNDSECEAPVAPAGKAAKRLGKAAANGRRCTAAGL